MNACPCGRLDVSGKPRPYVQCCGLYLEGWASAPAPDAQALMRSRYSAYVLERGAYLLATWHASKRPTRVTFDAGGKWLGLEVRDARATDADHAEVEFIARRRDASGRAIRLHERSRFVREKGRWYYVDGDRK